MLSSAESKGTSITFLPDQISLSRQLLCFAGTRGRETFLLILRSWLIVRCDVHAALINSLIPMPRVLSGRLFLWSWCALSRGVEEHSQGRLRVLEGGCCRPQTLGPTPSKGNVRD